MTSVNCVSKFCVIKKTVCLLILCAIILVSDRGANGKICPETQVYNTPEGLKALENCTVIVGSLKIVLIENTSLQIIRNYTFPDLREITGYLLLYRVFNLTSLTVLFPNLTVIRGNVLLSHYALILFDLIHLSHVGLPSLVHIQKGFVMIANCLALCNTKNIDWHTITDEFQSHKYGYGSIIQQDDDRCYSEEYQCTYCPHEKCWDELTCQKFDTNTSVLYKYTNISSNTSTISNVFHDYTAIDYSDDTDLSSLINVTEIIIKCHPECLGGCYNTTAKDCVVCRRFKYNNTCVETCPNNTLTFKLGNMCLNEITCRKMKWIPYYGECLSECPSGYQSINTTKGLACSECPDDKCIKTCNASELRTVASTDTLYGCTVITNNLELMINVDVKNAYRRLETNLGNITEIYGFLRVWHSDALTTLSFFKSLKIIRGEVYHYYDYALIIINNRSLKQLWNRISPNSIEVKSGKVLIQNNPILCNKEIKIFNYTVKYNGSMITSNGYNADCTTNPIDTWFKINSESTVWISWTPVEVPDTEKLLGYYIYYAEADESKDLKPFIEIPECNPTFWISYMIPVHHIQQNMDDTTILLTNLIPYTKYAYYVRTYVIQKAEMNILDVTQGQSKIKYFKTAPDRPNSPHALIANKTEHSIAISWFKVTKHDELIDEYVVEVVQHSNGISRLDERDYCLYPLLPDPPRQAVAYGEGCMDQCCRLARKSIYDPSEIYYVNDCFDGDRKYSEYLEFFMRNKEDCGPDDPKCEEAFNSFKFRKELTEFLSKRKMDQEEQEQEDVFLEKPKKKEKGKIMYPYGTPLRTERVSNTTFDMEFQNLKPFRLYSFFIYACSDRLGCGIPFILNEKTYPVPITTEIELNTTRDEYDVFINFDEPSDPNEALVYYNIEKTIINETTTEVHCITRKAHAKNNFRYNITYLLGKAVMIRVQAVSLGAVSQYSHFIYPGPNPKPRPGTPYSIGDYVLAIIGIASILGIILIISCAVYFVYFRKPYVRSSDEDILLQNIGRERSSISSHSHTFPEATV